MIPWVRYVLLSALLGHCWRRYVLFFNSFMIETSIQREFIVRYSSSFLKKRKQKNLQNSDPSAWCIAVSKSSPKVLANRLLRFFNDVIKTAQMAYTEERCIMDDFLYANGILHYSRRSEVQRAVCKHDFKKAFGRVNPRFLIRLPVMRYFPLAGLDGFPKCSSALKLS